MDVPQRGDAIFGVLSPKTMVGSPNQRHQHWGGKPDHGRRGSSQMPPNPVFSQNSLAFCFSSLFSNRSPASLAA